MTSQQHEWFPKEVDDITAAAVMQEGGEDEAIAAVMNEYLEEELVPHYIF